MTRNRIITKDDIRNFCFYELGERISQVEIERGFEVAIQTQQAFRRTIDVIIIPAKTKTLERKEWDFLCEQLTIKLRARSGMSSYYRVMVKEA